MAKGTMTMVIQTNNNNKGNDVRITTGCGLEGLQTKSELDEGEQDIKEVENIRSTDYVQTRWGFHL